VPVSGRIAIVIPTRNAGPALEDVLSAIDAQVGAFRPEIVAIDSGSSDGTVERLKHHGGRVLSVAPGAFNHGKTRNDALRQIDGDYAVLLVQDAIPASATWLATLVQPLLDDPSIAGTFARQVPRTSASRVTAHYLAQWVAAAPEPRTVGPLTRDAFDRMSPADRHAACAFDNVCSCIRLRVWNDHPFPATPIGEDLEWARDVLLAGYKLTYVPDAVVEHSHERSIAYELQRTYLVHQRLEALFGFTTVPTIGSLVRSIATTVPANARMAADEPSGRVRAVLRGAALGIAQPLGQYLGARAAREGRELLRTSRI
jgi:rhamnosyltransferase